MLGHVTKWATLNGGYSDTQNGGITLWMFRGYHVTIISGVPTVVYDIKVWVGVPKDGYQGIWVT